MNYVKKNKKKTFYIMCTNTIFIHGSRVLYSCCAIALGYESYL